MNVKVFTLLIAGLFLFNSCQDKKEESVSDIEIPHEIEETFVEDTSEENLFSNFESQPTIKNWMAYFESQNSNLNLGNFTLGESQKLEIIPGNVKGNFEADFNSTYEPFLIYNPSKTMYLDIDSYQWALDENGNPMFEADAEINLVKLKEKTVNRVAFYGPSFWVDDAFWVTDSIFILLENNYENQPSLQVYNLKENLVSPYLYSDSTRKPIEKTYILDRLETKGIILPKK